MSKTEPDSPLVHPPAFTTTPDPENILDRRLHAHLVDLRGGREFRIGISIVVIWNLERKLELLERSEKGVFANGDRVDGERRWGREWRSLDGQGGGR